MSGLAATGALLRLIVRRDRFVMPVWVTAAVGVTMLLVPTFRELAPTEADRASFAALANANPAFVALFGRVFDTSLGALVAWRAGPVPLLVGLVSMLTVIRHTRTEEEAGRRELLGSAAVGRHASLTAALLAAAVANAVLGAGLACGLMLLGLPVSGSIALGATYLSVGLVFAGVGGLAAQVTQGAGAARGLGVGVLGVAFVLRLAGDVGGEGAVAVLSWLSPIGWVQQARPFAAERWWVFALPAMLAVLLAVASVVVSAVRDVGSGLVAPRPGRPSASAMLAGPFGLALRLHRGLIVGWVVGFAALGTLFGGVADGMRDMLAGMPEIEEIIMRMGGEQVLIDAYLASMLGVLALVASGYAIQAGLRMRAEEIALRAESVLATAVSRPRWAASHVVLALAGPAMALAAAGAAAGLTYGLVAGGVAEQMFRLAGAALVHLPAVWILAGIAVAAFGILPRYTAVAWAALGVFFFLGQFGAVLQLEQWMLNLSPYTHVPMVPGGNLTAAPLLWLVAVATALTAAGLAGLRRRDVGAG